MFEAHQWPILHIFFLNNLIKLSRVLCSTSRYRNACRTAEMYSRCLCVRQLHKSRCQMRVRNDIEFIRVCQLLLNHWHLQVFFSSRQVHSVIHPFFQISQNRVHERLNCLIDVLKFICSNTQASECFRCRIAFDKEFNVEQTTRDSSFGSFSLVMEPARKHVCVLVVCTWSNDRVTLFRTTKCFHIIWSRNLAVVPVVQDLLVTSRSCSHSSHASIFLHAARCHSRVQHFTS